MIVTVLVIAVGLAMDAFAVSISNGMCIKNISLVQKWGIPLSFGAFQMAMPIMGYFLGSSFSAAISKIDHWIALILLAAIGINMIAGSIKDKKEDKVCYIEKFTLKELMIQSVATSIDALAVGISFALLNINIWFASAAIGVITFAISGIGIYIGRKLGGALKNKAEIVGGIILIAIGIKIFLEHVI